MIDANPFKLHFSWFPAKQFKVHLLGFCLNVNYFQVSVMGWFKFLKLSGCLAMMVMVCALNSANSTVLIHFDRAPPARSRFSTAVFQYSIKRPDDSDACKNNECSVHYQVSFFFIVHLFPFLVTLNCRILSNVGNPKVSSL